MIELLGLPYSPWTEKARFALDVKRVPYRFRHYQPLIGEPALRIKLRKMTGTVSVPVLFEDGAAPLPDSAAIAQWADARGEGPRLFPEEHRAEIDRFTALSERGLAAGRAVTLVRMLEHDDALAELVPPAMRGVLGSVGPRMAALGVERTMRKYGVRTSDAAEHRAAYRGALDELRAALAKAKAGEGPKTLLGALTFADIAMAQLLSSIDLPNAGLKVGAATRRAFTDPELREPYADLVVWRDELYRAYRAP